MRHITFWQNIPSIHQSALLRSLSARPDYQVSLIAEAEVPAWRSQMGWSRPDFGAAELVLAPPRSQWQALVEEQARRGAINILSGIGAYALVDYALKRLAGHGAPCGLFAEPVKARGLRRTVARWRHRLHALRWARRLSFILTTGDAGVTWYREAWFDARSIFPFGYFVEGPVKTTAAPAGADFTLLYAGGLVPWKRVDVLLDALAALTRERWRLLVAGDGPLRQQLQAHAQSLLGAERVTWCGSLANAEIYGLLAAADLLVLPSQWDGWGAVVNEALMCGVPVVCSDACGASTLISSSGHGEVFRAASVAALRAALHRALDRGRLTVERRQAIQRWSSCITGAAGARYLDAIITYLNAQGPRPRAPWKEAAGA